MFFFFSFVVSCPTGWHSTVSSSSEIELPSRTYGEASYRYTLNPRKGLMMVLTKGWCLVRFPSPAKERVVPKVSNRIVKSSATAFLPLTVIRSGTPTLPPSVRILRSRHTCQPLSLPSLASMAQILLWFHMRLFFSAMQFPTTCGSVSIPFPHNWHCLASVFLPCILEEVGGVFVCIFKAKISFRLLQTTFCHVVEPVVADLVCLKDFSANALGF